MERESGCTCNFGLGDDLIIGGYAGCPLHDPNYHEPDLISKFYKGIENKNAPIKKFEIGKAYQHNSGMQMFICGIGNTVYHGICFIAEKGWNRDLLYERIKSARENDEKMPEGGFDGKGLVPISMSPDAAVNWVEISKEEFIINNTCK